MDTLTFDERGFGTEAARIAWDNLIAVGIRTTADGPFAEDVFWQLLLREGLVELPGSMFHGGGLEGMQTHLRGFDSLKVVRAMGSCEERVFRVWHHEESRDRPEEPALRARFVELLSRLGAADGAGETFARLHAAWSSKARSYHTTEHLVDCLRELDRARPDGADGDLAELALWYHDAVCAPGSKDDEERSAAWLLADAAMLGVSATTARAATDLVRATAHGAEEAPRGGLADLVCDVDLTILGRDPLRFMEYEHSVGEEYAATPRLAFLTGRGRLLAGLLAAPAIYRTAPFRARYEAAARANVTALLRSPRYRAHRWLGWLAGAPA
jgi:predicted metal-dependent HD superfamily phosphohydrolase